MGDFLRGFTSARPMIDRDAERMRALAIQDHGVELRQRRALQDLPGFLQGDPAAEMSLAAMGIGKGPQSQLDAQRYADAQARSEIAAQERRQKFAWEKQYAQEGRDMQKMLSDRAFQQKQYEIDWRDEQASKADKRRDLDLALQMEDRFAADEAKAAAKTRQGKLDKRAEEQAKLRQRLTTLQIEDVEEARKRKRDRDALTTQQGESMNEMFREFAGEVVGPPDDTSPLGIANRGIKMDKMKARMMKMYESLGGPKATPDQRMRLWQSIKDEIDPEGQEAKYMAQATRQMTLKSRAEAEAKKQNASMERTANALTATTPKEFKSNLKNMNEVELTDVIGFLSDEISTIQNQASGSIQDMAKLQQAQARIQIAQEAYGKKKAKGAVKQPDAGTIPRNFPGQAIGAPGGPFGIPANPWWLAR